MDQCAELLRGGDGKDQTGVGGQRVTEGDQLEKLLECKELNIDDGENSTKVVKKSEESDSG